MANEFENTAEENVLNEMGYYYDEQYDEDFIADYYSNLDQYYHKKGWNESNIINQKLAEVALLLGGPMIKDEVDYSNWRDSQEKDLLTNQPTTGYTKPFPIIKPYGLNFGGSGLNVDIDLLSAVESGLPGVRFSTDKLFGEIGGTGRNERRDHMITTKHDIPAPRDKWRFGINWRF